MDLKVLSGLGKATGVGGVALGVVALLLKDILANQVFQGLPPEKAYPLLLIITIGLFILGSLGILAWAFAHRMIHKSSPGSTKVHAEAGAAAFGDKAKGNSVTINNATAPRQHDAGP